MLHLLKKAGFQGDSCLVGICPAQLAATADGFDFRLHGGQVEILAVDDPRRGGDDLRRGQGLLPDQAFDDGVADTQPRGRLLDGEPGIVVAMVGEMVIVPGVLHAVHPPRLATSGPVPESVQGGGDRGVAAHLGQLSNQIDRGPIRSHASVTSPVTRHAQLRMHAALPVQMEDVFAVGLIGIDDDLVKHRAQDPFLQVGRRVRMVPHRREVVAEL